jgi:hypothetical protein
MHFHSLPQSIKHASWTPDTLVKKGRYTNSCPVAYGKIRRQSRRAAQIAEYHVKSTRPALPARLPGPNTKQ